MNDANRFEQIEALIAQFQALHLRELHVRCGDIEIYLSNTASETGVRTGDGRSARRIDVDPAATKPDSAPRPRAATQTGLTERPGAATAAPLDLQNLPPGHSLVRAPYVGTFYRSPKPGAPAFVEVGAAVESGTDLCLVEVMKLFTTLRAQAPGRVHAVLAADGSLVAAEQPLFVLVPA